MDVYDGLDMLEHRNAEDWVSLVELLVPRVEVGAGRHGLNV